MKFIKKPVRVNAWRWTGSQDQEPKPEWLKDEDFKIRKRKGKAIAEVKTHQGIVKANLGDWIILQSDGEVYPCNNKTFEESYESAEVVMREKTAQAKTVVELREANHLLQLALRKLGVMSTYQHLLREGYKNILIEVMAYRNSHKSKLGEDYEEFDFEEMEEKAPKSGDIRFDIERYLKRDSRNDGHNGSTSPFNREAREHLDECIDRAVNNTCPPEFADAIRGITDKIMRQGLPAVLK